MTARPSLPDVNVLIALIDPSHVHHDAAHAWFGSLGDSSWATCPITESGVVRIVGHARYTNGPGTPGAVVSMLMSLCSQAGHAFWPDDVSWCDVARFDRHRLLDSAQVTDSHLLALAVTRGARLVTFDRRLVTAAVHGGAKALHLL